MEILKTYDHSQQPTIVESTFSFDRKNSVLMRFIKFRGRLAVRLSVVGAILLTILPSAHAQDSGNQKQVDSTSVSFDVDELFRRSIVIDGTVNYYSTATGSGIGQPDFSSDNQGRTVKQATGIDIGGITLSRLESLQAQAASLMTGRYKGALLIRSAADIDEAVRTRQYGIMFYAQQHYPLNGTVENIEHWYDEGLRIMQLQYSARDANQEPEERLGGGPTQEGGLTQLGEKVVQELIRLGIVVDLAHCNTQTTIDTAKIAKQHNVPITANHVGARNVKSKDGRWLARYARNATDEKMLAVKNTGGVVGVMGYGPYLRGPYQELRMQPPEENIAHATVDDFVTHVEYVVNLIGIDHVGLCTDGYLDGTMAHNRTADGVLDSPRRWKEVIIRLHHKGYDEEDLQKLMGLNFLRVYRQILKSSNNQKPR
jgi:membrane dipeptidase